MFFFFFFVSFHSHRSLRTGAAKRWNDQWHLLKGFFVIVFIYFTCSYLDSGQFWHDEHFSRERNGKNTHMKYEKHKLLGASTIRLSNFVVFSMLNRPTCDFNGFHRTHDLVFGRCRKCESACSESSELNSAHKTGYLDGMPWLTGETFVGRRVYFCEEKKHQATAITIKWKSMNFINWFATCENCHIHRSRFATSCGLQLCRQIANAISIGTSVGHLFGGVINWIYPVRGRRSRINLQRTLNARISIRNRCLAMI